MDNANPKEISPSWDNLSEIKHRTLDNVELSPAKGKQKAYASPVLRELSMKLTSQPFSITIANSGQTKKNHSADYGIYHPKVFNFYYGKSDQANKQRYGIRTGSLDSRRSQFKEENHKSLMRRKLSHSPTPTTQLNQNSRKPSSTKFNSIPNKLWSSDHSKIAVEQGSKSNTGVAHRSKSIEPEATHKIKPQKYQFSKTTSFNMGSLIKSGAFSQSIPTSNNVDVPHWSIPDLEDLLTLKERIAEFSRQVEAIKKKEKVGKFHQELDLEEPTQNDSSSLSCQKKVISIKPEQPNKEITTNNVQQVFPGSSISIPLEPKIRGKAVGEKIGATAAETAEESKKSRKFIKKNFLSLDFNPDSDIFTLKHTKDTGNPIPVDETTLAASTTATCNDGQTICKRFVRFTQTEESDYPITDGSALLSRKEKVNPTSAALKKRQLVKDVKNKSFVPIVQKRMNDNGIRNNTETHLLDAITMDSIRNNLNDERKMDFNGIKGLESKIPRLTNTAIMKVKSIRVKNKMTVTGKTAALKQKSKDRFIVPAPANNMTRIKISSPPPVRIAAASFAKKKPNTKSIFALPSQDVGKGKNERIEDETFNNEVKHNEQVYSTTNNGPDLKCVEAIEAEVAANNSEIEEDVEVSESGYNINISMSEMSVSSYGDFDEPSASFLKTLGSISSLSKDNDPTANFDKMYNSDGECFINPYLSDSTKGNAITTIENKYSNTKNYVINKNNPFYSEIIMNRKPSRHWKPNKATNNTAIRLIKTYERINNQRSKDVVFGIKGSRSTPTLKNKVITSKTTLKSHHPKEKSDVINSTYKPAFTNDSENVQNIYLNDRFDYSITNFFLAADLDNKPGTSNLRELSARGYKPPWRTSEFKLLSKLKSQISSGDEEVESSESSASDA